MGKEPMISIPLDLPDVRVLRVELTKQQEYLIAIESTLTTATCHRCGQPISERHGTGDPIVVRHLPILGHPVYLRLRPKRFRCRRCDGHPTSTQPLDWYTPTLPTSSTIRNENTWPSSSAAAVCATQRV